MPVSTQDQQQLMALTKQKLDKMFLDKKQTPKLLIPKNLPSFIKTQIYKNCLLAIYEYVSAFSEIMKGYSDLSMKLGVNIGYNQTPQEAPRYIQRNFRQSSNQKAQRNIDVKLLQSEREELGKLEREVSYCYSAIIIGFNSQCLKEDGKRSNFKDQVFFEALIYLIQRVLKQMFSRQDFLLVQQEIHRLFRTNRYNLIKKRHQNDQVLHKYPALKQQKQKHKNNLAGILTRAPERIAAYKKYQREKKFGGESLSKDYTQTLGIPKQLANADMEQRSPLLCTWLPSKKTMVNDMNSLNSYQNQLIAMHQNSNKRLSDQIDSEYQSEYGSNTRDRARMASLGHRLVQNKDIRNQEDKYDDY